MRAAYRIASYVMVPVRAQLAEFFHSIFDKASPDGISPGARTAAGRAARRVALAVLLAVPLLTAAAAALPLVGGQEYAASLPYAVVLIPAIGLRGFHYLYGDLLVAAQRPRLRVLAQAVGLGLPLLACFVLVQFLGLWGAVLATAVGEVMAVLVMRRFAHRLLATPAQTAAAPVKEVAEHAGAGSSRNQG